LIRKIFALLVFISIIFSCSTDKDSEYNPGADSLRFTGEYHLRNVTQLTFGGNNAEAYWSFDNQKLVFQSDWDKINNQGCDQIFVMNADGSKLASGKQYQLVSTGLGRTTCSYFLTDGRIIYSSTHAADKDCPDAPMFMGGRYVWAIYDTYDIYVTDENYENEKLLIGGEGYDAEPTVSPDGKYIIFTSTRSGDLELWRYEIATEELLQLTSELGYDGGAFFSHDSKKIVWRASRPTGTQAEIYKDLLEDGFVEPKALNIFVADIDGKNAVQVTNFLGANWAPYFHPSNQKIVFASNHHSLKQGGRIFDIFLINIDGTGLQQITNSNTFDAFPMFSHDGKKIAFASNRRTDEADSRETNVFVADWIEKPTAADMNFKKPNSVAAK
jgi:Tol biopolymer transport system component